jgi:hypothetical protein
VTTRSPDRLDSQQAVALKEIRQPLNRPNPRAAPVAKPSRPNHYERRPYARGRTAQGLEWLVVR